MSAPKRRRRTAVLLGLALACGGLAASRVSEREREVAARVGEPVSVVVAARELPANTKISPGKLPRLLAVREVPERFAPPDALTSPDEAVGLRTATPVAAGGYMTIGSLETGERADDAGPLLGRGERAVEIVVAGSEGLADYAGPGARVDVLVTNNGRTYVALENVELLAIVAGQPDAAGDGSGSTATLRVTVRQAVYLTAAHNFAREIRLLARSPGDRGRAGGVAIDGRSL